LDAALRDATRAVETGPTRHQNFEQRHIVRMAMEDYEGALQDAEIILGLTKGNFPPVYQYRSVALQRLGRLDEAIDDLEEYLRIRPNFGDSDDVRGQLKELEQRRAARENRGD
jgi:regulator of sirC expression with transglutaminase-like and TPR domain